MKKRIALDMDEVIADVLSKFLELYEAKMGYVPDESLYTGKKLYQLEGGEDLRDALFHKGFFADLDVIEGAQEGVRWLMEHYEVYITTAAMEFVFSLEDKYNWLLQHFPFIHWKQFVFLGDKSILGAEYMIDDHAFNLETFQGKGLLFTAYHNVNETRFTRVNNWGEVRTFFEGELLKGEG